MVDEAPANLIINLKKFDKFGAKIKSGLDYPNQFVLNDYFCKSSAKKSAFRGEFKYELYGVINHEGNYSTRGHYNCFVKEADDNWYLCDDAKIKNANGKFQNSSDKAYILFYRLADSSKKGVKSKRSSSNVSTEDALSD